MRVGTGGRAAGHRGFDERGQHEDDADRAAEARGEAHEHGPPPVPAAQAEEHRECERTQQRVGVAHHEHERVGREQEHGGRALRERAVAGLEGHEADEECGADERAQIGDDDHSAARVDEREQPDRAAREREEREEPQALRS